MEKKSRIKQLRIRIANIFWEIIIKRIVSAISYLLILIGNFALGIITIFFKVILKTPVRLFVSIVKPLHQKLGSVFPFNIKDKLAKRFIYAGLVRYPEEILGVTLMYSILFPVVVSLISMAFSVQYSIIAIAVLISFILVWVALIMIVTLLVERRTSSIEEVLPDVLSMVSQNMMAGMTPYNALWVAARPEFGPLAMEIQTVARDSLAGSPLEDALTAMTTRVKSDKLDRSVRLMIQGMKSGGDLSTVLQEIANDIRNEQNLLRRMHAETTAQAMFIVFAIAIGAPLLFASSLKFIAIFSEIYSNIETVGLKEYAQTGMATLHPLSIPASFFYWYAISILIISASFGALLVGLIRSGKLSSGITLIPILTAVAVFMFLGLTYALDTVFRTIIIF